jgi:inhibitor of KinA
MLLKPRYLSAGESALVVEFGDTIDPKIHDLVMALDAAIQRADIEGVTETVPTYRSLMIHFDPRRRTTEALTDALAGLDYVSAPPRTRQQFWRIPACYDAPHRSASWRALPSLYVWLRARVHVSWRPPK